LIFRFISPLFFNKKVPCPFKTQYPIGKASDTLVDRYGEMRIQFEGQVGVSQAGAISLKSFATKLIAPCAVSAGVRRLNAYETRAASRADWH
jgi:hypothetical protein